MRLLWMPLPIKALRCRTGAVLAVEAAVPCVVDHSSRRALSGTLQLRALWPHEIVKGTPIVTAFHPEGHPAIYRIPAPCEMIETPGADKTPAVPICT